MHEVCYLVELDLKGIEDKKFIEKDTIKVSFKEIFRSCALISKHKVLIFASEQVISISLENKIQKAIEFPYIFSEIVHSFNMIGNDKKSCLIVTG